MKSIDTFLLMLSALWLCGSALAVGLVISRRNKNMPATRMIFIWGFVFSWAFVGWIVGEMMAAALKTLGDISSSVKGHSKESS